MAKVAGQPDRDEPDPGTEIRAFLASLGKDELVELFGEAAERDERLRDRLLMEQAQRAAGFDPAPFRKAITRAFSNTSRGRHGAEYTSREWAADVHGVIDQLEEALSPQSAAEIVKVCEHALRTSDRKKGQIDDSSGWFAEIDEQLEALHHDACLLAAPDPVKLARKLFEWETTGDWDTFDRAVLGYGDVLGERGADEYRRLATAAWEEVAPLGPGADDHQRWSGPRFRITRMMEALAEQDGDVDALIDVKSRDLSSAWCFVQIAELCREHGRDDESLGWAERGLEAFGVGTDARLDEFIADEYEHQGRADDAVMVGWRRYEHAPSLGTYRFLHEHAARAGVWPDWRAKALEVLTKRLDDAPTRARSAKEGRRLELVGRYEPDARSTLVEVHLWEGDAEAAWEVAGAGGVPHRLWMQLARAREADHPLDVIPIYEREVERLVQVKKNDAYAEAVEVMRRVAGLLDRAGRSGEFPDYVARVRTAHKPKRNLMAMLDQGGW